MRLEWLRRRESTKLLRRLLCRPRLEQFEDRLAPATFTVLNTADSGTGSLRQAISDANATANVGGVPDQINFNIPGAGVHTISPTSAFDPITQAVIIDGYTQPKNDGSGTLATPNTLAVGDNAVLLIQIDCSSYTSQALFDFEGGDPTVPGSTVQGLVINHMAGQSFIIGSNTPSNNNMIVGNFLGTDAAGTTFLPGVGSQTVIAVAGGTGNTIGGTTPGARNVIAGGGDGGSATIALGGSGAGGIIVQGNYIGLNAAGTAALSAPRAITENGSSAGGNTVGGTRPGAGNVIVSSDWGISLVRDNNVIQGNFIGTNATGTAGLGGGTGIFSTTTVRLTIRRSPAT